MTEQTTVEGATTTARNRKTANYYVFYKDGSTDEFDRKSELSNFLGTIDDPDKIAGIIKGQAIETGNRIVVID